VDFALKRLDVQSTSVVNLGRDPSSPPKPTQEKASAVEGASPAATARVGEMGLGLELRAPLADAAVPLATESTPASPAPAAEAVEAASTYAAPAGGCTRKRGRRSARQPKENAQPNQPAPKMARKSKKARCKQAQASSDEVVMPESDGDE
jgi:hypothetical protein